MAVYIISYDLNKQKNYPALYDAIKSAGTNWCHPMDSTWLVVSSATSSVIRDHIARAMDKDDSLLVCKVAKGDSAWRGLSQQVSDWLKANL
ncbi:hypothetical protein C2862_24645 [Massilia sp. Mn16-1_5]|nr:hypothetical protein C2862_24645 [Massilia sp. Mn16-1_5]